MPGLARKLLIYAAVDGLIIQPLANKGQRPSHPVKVKYGEATVSAAARDQSPNISQPNSSFEAFGVVGKCTFPTLNGTDSRPSPLSIHGGTKESPL